MSRKPANSSFELEDDKNDFLQRALNSSFASLNTRLPAIGTGTTPVRLHSHSIPTLPSQAETRLRSEQVALKMKESKPVGPLPKTRDLSFIEPELARIPFQGPIDIEEPQSVFTENLSALMSSSAKVVLVNSEIFDEDKLRHFCKSMLKRNDTEKFTFLPVKGLGNPVNRRDAELLTKWVEKMESQIMSKSNARDFFEGLQVVYGLCLKELTRQVAVHCYERGALLDRILSAYVFLFEKVILSYKKDIHKLAYDSKAKTAKLHELYLWQLDEFKKQLHEQSNIAASLKEEVENAKQTEAAMIMKEKTYQDRVKKLQISYEEVARKLVRFEKRYGLLEDSDASGFNRKNMRDTTLKSTIKSQALLTFAKLSTIESEVDSGPYGTAVFIFQHFLTKYVIRFTGVEGEMIILSTKRTQTRWKRFPTPLVQVESFAETEDFFQRGRKATKIFQEEFQEDSPELEKLVTTLHDMEMLMRSIPVDKLPESLKNSYSALKIMAEKSLSMSKSAHKYSAFLTQMVKQMQADDIRKEDVMLNSETRCKQLEDENNNLRGEIDDLRNRLHKAESLRPPQSHDQRRNSKSGTNEHAVKRAVTFDEEKRQNRKILFKRSSTLPSTQLLEKFNSAPIKSKCVMTIKTLLKLLSSILSEYQVQAKTNPAVKNQELVHFCYEWFMTKHGLKGVTEQKFVQLLTACDFFKENPKVHLFARFLQLYEPLSGEDFRFFVGLTNALNHWGSSVDMAETEDSYVGSSECYQVLVETLLPKFPDIDARKLRFELEMQADRLNKFKVFDFLLFAIKRFRVAMSTNQNYVTDLFKAADLNGDSFIEQREFIVLCRQIVKDKSKLVNIDQVFASAADLMVKYSEEDEPKPVISLDKFAALSVEYDLFGSEAQKAFLDIQTDDDIFPLYAAVQCEIDSIIATMKSRIPKNDSRYETLLSHIDLLSRKVKGEGDDRVYYIAYKLLDGESKRVYLR